MSLIKTIQPNDASFTTKRKAWVIYSPGQGFYVGSFPGYSIELQEAYLFSGLTEAENTNVMLQQSSPELKFGILEVNCSL